MCLADKPFTGSLFNSSSDLPSGLRPAPKCDYYDNLFSKWKQEGEDKYQRDKEDRDRKNYESTINPAPTYSDRIAERNRERDDEKYRIKHPSLEPRSSNTISSSSTRRFKKYVEKLGENVGCNDSESSIPFKKQTFSFPQLSGGYKVETVESQDIHEHHYPEKHETEWGARIDRLSRDSDSSEISRTPAGQIDAEISDTGANFWWKDLFKKD